MLDADGTQERRSLQQHLLDQQIMILGPRCIVGIHIGRVEFLGGVSFGCLKVTGMVEQA